MIRITVPLVGMILCLVSVELSFPQSPASAGRFCFDLTVTDRDGRRIAGLQRDDLRVTSDGRPQAIDAIVETRAALTLAILIDTSGSTSAVLKEMRQRAIELVSLLGPADRAMILAADVDVRTLQGLTSNKKKLTSGIMKAARAEPPPPEAVPTPQPNNIPVPLTERIGMGRQLTTSNLRDALTKIITGYFARANGVKAAVILSDGMITGKMDADQFLDMLKESEVRIYPLFYQTIDPRPYLVQIKVIDKATTEISSEQFFRYWPPAAGMRFMADYTGGRITAASDRDMSPYWKRIVEELTAGYRLSVSSSGPLSVSTQRANAVTQVTGPLPTDRACPF